MLLVLDESRKTQNTASKMRKTRISRTGEKVTEESGGVTVLDHQTSHSPLLPFYHPRLETTRTNILNCLRNRARHEITLSCRTDFMEGLTKHRQGYF